MGRGGGSGGRSSGGSFGGGRSSGGRSGGSFGFGGGGTIGRSGGSIGRSGGSFGSSFGSKGRSIGSNSGSSSFGGPSFGSSFGRPGGIHVGSTGGGFRRNSGPSGCGCLTIIIVVVVLIIIIVAVSSLAGLFSSFEGSSSNNFDITKSSIDREPLPAGVVNETDYYTDELGWIGNRTKLTEGLKYFYKKTGVQPYLYITDEVNGSHFPTESEMDSFANNLYDELFTDEAHLLFVFHEYDERYMYWYVGGAQTKTVIDNEAADILMDYVDKYYFSENLSDEEFFSKSFSDSADRIMTVTKSPWITVWIVIGVVILVLILFTWWKKSKKQKNIEAKRMDDILNTPLDRFGDTEADEIAKKYEDINENDQNDDNI